MVYSGGAMKAMNAETFGRNVTRLRRTRRWSQRELAERLHTDQSMVTRWEKGKVLPRPETIDRLASVFETTVEELMLMSQEEPLRISGPVEDPELLQLLTLIHVLEENDRQALKAVLRAMLTQARLKDVMGSTSTSLGLGVSA